MDEFRWLDPELDVEPLKRGAVEVVISGLAILEQIGRLSEVVQARGAVGVAELELLRRTTAILKARTALFDAALEEQFGDSADPL